MPMPYTKKHDNDRWYVHWTEGRVGKRESLGTKDEAEAATRFGEWLTDRATSTPEIVGAHLTLADVWDAYYKRHVLVKVAGQYNADLAWKLLGCFFGALPAAALTQDAVDEYVRQRTTGKLGRVVKPHTVAKELSYVIAAVRFCADDRRKIIGRECVRKWSLPEPGAARDRWLRQEEIDALYAAGERLRRDKRMSRGERFIRLALETAGRKQALLDLTWDRVDFETNTIRLDVPGRRATKKRRATVPISKTLRPVLEQMHKERINDFVLDNQGAVWATVQNIVIEAGLVGEREKTPRGQKPKRTGISPHVFRHTAATMMVRRRVPIYLVAKILGNSVKMVTDVYGHHAKEDLQEAVDLISVGAGIFGSALANVEQNSVSYVSLQADKAPGLANV